MLIDFPVTQINLIYSVSFFYLPA